MKKIVKESARDLLGLASIPFFILLLVRVSLLENWAYFFQFLIAGSVFLILTYFLKSDIYAGLGFIMLFFINLYYLSLRFLIFSIVLYGLLISSLIYFKKKKILISFIIGLISSLITYYFIQV